MNTREIALANEILRGVVGSTAHGIAIEGTDDRDEMGIFIEPPEFVCGLKPCDHYIYRDKPEGARSGPGDLDLTLYSLRKFCRLAVQGNPSVLLLLWLPSYVKDTLLGRNLVVMRRAFVSQEAGQRFLGYLISQKMKMRGEKAHTVSRPDLVAAHGYDTKFASHALRLAYEGIELMTAGQLTLPIPEPRLSTLRAIRKGEVSEVDALALIDEAEATLRAVVAANDRRVDRDLINQLMASMHFAHWRLT